MGTALAPRYEALGFAGTGERGDGVSVYVAGGGDGEPVLLLLHGLGATGAVWDGLAELLPGHWPGAWVIPDLPGHGRSDRLPRYSMGAMAAAVAEAVEPGRRVVVLGHSLGGAVGLALASGWFGVDVVAVCGLGIKVRWSADDLAKAAQVAARPGRVFGSRAEAAERALRVAGLTGLASPDSPVLDSAVTEADGGWRLTLDPAAFGVGAPAMTGLLRACHGEVILAAGEHDPMSPREHLADLLPDPVVLPGLGHNAHVEDPAALLPVLDRLHG
ncbi:MAG TPA: alpha/beta hydrolase [Actinophytocola sp.]|uniref:alpha/beta fold hydrolase n=1 Tax=Actinophytocola sp. TaxID=1872138 RepID=UPI002DDD347A|nr:alpha/beta hydrolase [Actinophytocola sp.]HEV2779384.1 alpha/beta hydrolase [Actinophytocola sp.]